MRLYQPDELDWEQVTLLCRQGRLMGVVGRVLLASILVGATIFWKVSGAPWPVWSICGLLSFFLVPHLVRGIFALFSSANWVVAITPHQVWINLRYFENRTLPPGATVAQIDLAEIASAGRHANRFTTPVSGSKNLRSVERQVESLQIELTHRATTALAEALDNERTRRAQPRAWLGGLVKVSSRVKQSTLVLPSPGVLQVLWRGGSNGCYVVPSLDRVLTKLAPQVHVHEPQRRDFGNWHTLDEEEVNQLARQLAAQGEVIAATKLLMRKEGLSLVEAKTRIEQYAAAADENRPPRQDSASSGESLAGCVQLLNPHKSDGPS